MACQPIKVRELHSSGLNVWYSPSVQCYNHSNVHKFRTMSPWDPAAFGGGGQWVSYSKPLTSYWCAHLQTTQASLIVVVIKSLSMGSMNCHEQGNSQM